MPGLTQANTTSFFKGSTQHIPMSRFRNVVLASGLFAFAAAGLSFPFFLVTSRNKPIIDSSKPLPPQATFRGPYINTGSRDIGPDSTTSPKL